MMTKADSEIKISKTKIRDAQSTPRKKASADAVWPPPLDEHPVTPCGDVANAHRIHRHFGRDLLYVDGIGWLVWDGATWNPDGLGALRYALRLGEIVAKEAAELTAQAGELDPDGKRFLEQVDFVDDVERERVSTAKKRQKTAEALSGWAKKCERDGPRLPRALGFSQSYLSLPAERLDADRMLLPCANGTVDLRTGKLRPHRREDFFTVKVDVPFDSRATAPIWVRFVSDVFGGDEELIAYIQRACGYCLTGDVSEHVLFLAYGSGANGKSTLLAGLQATMGRFMRPAAPGLLMAVDGDRHPTDLADIRGARLVSASETTDGKSLDEERVKWLVGGDRLKARRMRQDFFEFDPTAKFWLATNHKPVIRGADYGIWRRIHLIPFAVTFEPDRQDKLLPQKLALEAAGILNWMIAGCLEWRKIGLAPPRQVLAATEEYRDQMDTLGEFLDEHVVEDRTSITAAKDIYAGYKKWCMESGLRVASAQAFGRKLSERGYKRGRTNTGAKGWEGVRLRTQTDLTDTTVFPVSELYDGFREGEPAEGSNRSIGQIEGAL